MDYVNEVPSTATQEPDPLASPHDETDPVNVWLVGQSVSASQRRNRYTTESFCHPAKMLPELARRIIQTYSDVDELVVDLMSGIGTSGIEALWLDRKYIGVEVEREYVQLQQNNLDLAQAQGSPGREAQVVCGDARQDLMIREAALVTFSPPYQDAIHDQGDELGRIQRKIASGEASPELVRRFQNWNDSRETARAGTRPSGYSPNPHNLGHLQGPRYWASMREVYNESFRSLRPGGYLVVVTKDQRDRKTGELTNLYGETVAVCREVGFMLFQHITAILCKIDETTGDITPRTSHWQRMAVRKAAEKRKIVLLNQFEDVIVFRKPTLDTGE